MSNSADCTGDRRGVVAVLRVAASEASRVIRRPRGKVLLALVALLPVIIVLPTVVREPTGAAAALSQGQLLIRLYDIDVARRLFDCPEPLAQMAILLFAGTPLVTLFLAYDSVPSLSTEEANETRPLRIRLAAGTVLGVCGAFAGLTLAPNVLVSILEIARGHAHAATVVLGWTAMIYGAACMIAAPFAALWVFVSAMSRSTWQGFLGGSLVALLLCLCRGYLHQKSSPYEGVLPNALELSVLSDHFGRALAGVLACAAWAAAGTAAAAVVARRRSA